MRLVFAGTTDFAARALAALLDDGHDAALVLTQPDRPSGRGLQLAPSPVKRLASARGLEIFQPEALKSVEAAARVRAAQPEVIVVAAYGLILPQTILNAAPHGALNIHASLLPRWRGAAPIQWALLAGDRESGISIMQMDAGVDTGPLLAQRGVAIADDEDAGSLHDKLATLGAKMIVAALRSLSAGRASAAAQNHEAATYARKIDKQDTVLDWSRPAVDLERAVRAFRPSPGAMMYFDGAFLKVWRTGVVEATGAPGTLLRTGDALVIACGQAALAVRELQRPGGKRLTAEQFLRGRPLMPGTRFDMAPR